MNAPAHRRPHSISSANRDLKLYLRAAGSSPRIGVISSEPLACTLSTPASNCTWLALPLTASPLIAPGPTVYSADSAAASCSPTYSILQSRLRALVFQVTLLRTGSSFHWAILRPWSLIDIPDDRLPVVEKTNRNCGFKHASCQRPTRIHADTLPCLPPPARASP